MNYYFSTRLKASKIEETVTYNRQILDYFHSYLEEISFISESNSQIHRGIAKYLDKIKANEKIILRSCLADYLTGKSIHTKQVDDFPLIFPFGCNLSQSEAVKRAFENNFSVIEGPPGTGKTQTILNIIANLLIRNQKVAIVSNNNAATKNVQEKLNSEQYQLGWLVAELGNRNNQNTFFDELPSIKLNPDWSHYEADFCRLAELAISVNEIFKKRIQLQELKTELSSVEDEIVVFLEEEEQKGTTLWLWTWYSNNLSKLKKTDRVRLQKNCLSLIDTNSGIEKWFKKIILRLRGCSFVDQIENNLDAFLSANIYAEAVEKRDSLLQSINEIQQWLESHKSDEEQYIEKSKEALFSYIWNNFNGEPDREFDIQDYKNNRNFWDRFPIVTSSTYALHRSKPNRILDYVIIDEASQVNLPTAAVCLSCAKKAVVVGDLKQLPVIFPNKPIRPQRSISPAYDASKHSILSSCIDAFGKNLPKTMLREHYRCHPDIINFCNKRFYDNQLIVMTRRTMETPAFTWIDTEDGVVKHVKGSLINERQKLVSEEWLSYCEEDDRKNGNIAVIAPYRAHADSFDNVISSTVHRFQGRECDQVLFNTVKNETTKFNNDPHLINVAVSRAKTHFILVSPTYEEYADSNLASLVRYIRHLDPEYRQLKRSKYRSIFDVLYKKRRYQHIPKRNSGESPAEALFRNLLLTLQNDSRLGYWEFTQEYPLRLLPKTLADFALAEQKYMFNGARLDFLLFDAFDKQPIAVIEVDGASYHQAGTNQASRDALKNSILKKLNIPLFRFRTDTAEGLEQEKMRTFLSNLYADRNKNASANAALTDQEKNDVYGERV